jgi:hypothetical protein
MKSYRKELWFDVPGRRAFINITPRVEECLRDSGIREGIALVNAMHITASVFISRFTGPSFGATALLTPWLSGPDRPAYTFEGFDRGAGRANILGAPASRPTSSTARVIAGAPIPNDEPNATTRAREMNCGTPQAIRRAHHAHRSPRRYGIRTTKIDKSALPSAQVSAVARLPRLARPTSCPAAAVCCSRD